MSTLHQEIKLKKVITAGSVPDGRDPPLGYKCPETESEVLAFLQKFVPLGHINILEVQFINFQATWRDTRSGHITTWENFL
jgi:uncharacterized SAM-binding protein YcdF (DUF218 family)